MIDAADDKRRVTGKVCIPMDPDTIDSFDPMDVPTVYKLAALAAANTDTAEGMCDLRARMTALKKWSVAHETCVRVQ